MKQFTLPKSERLYLRESISDLFANGRSFSCFPYRVTYLLNTHPENELNPKQARCAIMAVCPKKRFKHAVDRNHVKRLTREAYRLQKLTLIAALQEYGCSLEISFIYCDSKFISFDETYRLIGKALSRLVSEVKKAKRQIGQEA